MNNQAEVNEVQGANSWKDIFLSLSRGEEAEFQKPRKGVLLVPVKDASRTFGLFGVLDLTGIRWWSVHWFWIGHWVCHIDGLIDHSSVVI